jgi:hypothetical protein
MEISFSVLKHIHSLLYIIPFSLTFQVSRQVCVATQNNPVTLNIPQDIALRATTRSCNPSFVDKVGHAVAQFVEALCFKPVGRGFDSGVTGIFHWRNPFGRLGSTPPLTEMRTRNISWWVKVADA